MKRYEGDLLSLSKDFVSDGSGLADRKHEVNLTVMELSMRLRTNLLRVTNFARDIQTRIERNKQYIINLRL